MKRIGLTLLLIACTVWAEPPPAASIKNDADLRFMATSVKKLQFSASNPPQETVAALLELALGKDHPMKVVVKPYDSAAAKLNLDLHDIPVFEALRYIAELSSTRIIVKGSPGPPTVLIQGITEPEEHPPSEATKTFECTAEGARHFGLHPNMTNSDVQKLLTEKGIKFSEQAAALWNDKTLLLAMRNLPTQNAHLTELMSKANVLVEHAKSTPSQPDPFSTPAPTSKSDPFR